MIFLRCFCCLARALTLLSMILLLKPSSTSSFLINSLTKASARRFQPQSRATTRMSSSIAISIPEAIKLHQTQDDVVFVDGSWFLNRERTARQDFEAGPRILGAKFFDIDDIATPSSLAHMMPSPTLFMAAMDAMGITNDSTVILYGQAQCPMVHRAWYQIYAMGHELSRTKVLDGSVADWAAAGGPLDNDIVSVFVAKDLDLSRPSKYISSGPRQVVDKQHVLNVCDGTVSNTVIIDARSSERFYAKAPEPRQGLRLGHMPGAKNVPFIFLLDPNNVNRLVAKDELLQKFGQAGILVDEPVNIVTTCGSGATACTIAAALIECGKDPSQVAIYDGSWMEWGADTNTPIVTTDD